MNLWFFSEAAYPNLPPADEFESIRVTLPNGVIDPDLAATWWDDYLAEWQAASELGIGVMLNEHHGTATCMNSAVPISAGILARLTENTPILILGNPIANRRDPVRVAEEMAMVDVFSRGRLEVGFVRGVPYEICATNTNPVGMSERFWEAHDVIKLAWTSHDGPVNWQGRHFEHRQINIWPRPYQQPHPPIWITSGSPNSARQTGRYGYVNATFLSGYEGTGKIFDSYRQAYREAHLTEAPLDRLGYAALVYTGRTDEEGYEGARKLMWYLSANKVPTQFSNPPGYLPAEVRAASVHRPLYAPQQLTLESLIERGIVFAGSPATVAEQLRRFMDHVGGFGHLMIMGQAGFLSREQTISSLRRFVEDVQPRLGDVLQHSAA
jgi:alkanesulfonate monooxygenase SsuD/methylene tetrahydromethanopterin reductase-like flavin-dependent oxidoreductase (luciferase family)